MRFEKRPAKKSKSGYTWRVSFEYRDIYHHKQTHTKSGFKTKREAELYALAKQKELDRSSSDDMTVDMVWQEVSKSMIGKLSGGSVAAYDSVYRNHVKDKLGEMMVRDLTYPTLQHYLDSDLPSGHLIRIKAIISKVIQYSLKSGIITSNPLAGIKIKGHKRREETPLTYEEIEQMVQSLIHPAKNCDHLRHYSYACLLLVGYYTGLRSSELFALYWSDVDLEKREIHVWKKIESRGDDGRYLRAEDRRISEALKSKNSNAILPMPNALVEILKKWREYRKDDYKLLFTDSLGHVIGYRACGDYLRKTAEKVGVEGFHLHKLRHAYITQLVVSGVDAKTAMTLARHANISTTLQVYTDISEDQRRRSVDKAFG